MRWGSEFKTLWFNLPSYSEMGENSGTRVSVEKILADADKEDKLRQKSTTVFKEVEPSIDLGNLLLTDLQPVDANQFRKNSKTFLDDLARDNTQLLFNEIWKLPVERFEDAILAKLPEPTTILPREKPIPKPKPPTKWEQYAKQKGIQKKKRGRMIWDEQAKEWRPRYGYKRVDDDKDKWLIEVPDNADPNEDQYEKLRKEKKEKVAKNELQRLRNIARNTKGGKGLILSTEFKPTKRKDKERLAKEIDIAKSSTASVGKFQQRLPKEKEAKNKGKKRKFEPVIGDSSSEKKRALDIWERVHKPDTLDITKAVNKHMADKEQRSSKRAEGKKKGGNKGKGGKNKSKNFKLGGNKGRPTPKRKGGGKGRR